MITPTDVVNRALGYNNLAQINSLDDDSPAAEAAQLQWEMCFNAFLQEYEWSFAKRAVTPARAAYQPLTWKYAYSLPDDFIRKIAFTIPEALRTFGRRTPHRPEVPHEIMRVTGQRHPFICSDSDDVILEYVSNKTLLEEFTPAAVEALELKLAEKLCLTLKRDPSGAQGFLQLYAIHLDAAKGVEPTSHGLYFLDNSGYDDSRLI